MCVRVAYLQLRIAVRHDVEAVQVEFATQIRESERLLLACLALGGDLGRQSRTLGPARGQGGRRGGGGRRRRGGGRGGRRRGGSERLIIAIGRGRGGRGGGGGRGIAHLASLILAHRGGGGRSPVGGGAGGRRRCRRWRRGRRVGQRSVRRGGRRRRRGRRDGRRRCRRLNELNVVVAVRLGQTAQIVRQTRRLAVLKGEVLDELGALCSLRA